MNALWPSGCEQADHVIYIFIYLYRVPTGAVSQTATSPSQYNAIARTLLPALNAVLSVGENTNLSDYLNNTELYSWGTGAWAGAGSLPNGRAAGDLVTLFRWTSQGSLTLPWTALTCWKLRPDDMSSISPRRLEQK